MREIGPFRLAFSMIGCFLGAGFVSGQEIWQYFGHYGKWGVAGLLLAICLLAALCGVNLALARRLKTFEIQRVAIPVENSLLRGLAGGVVILYLFSIYVVMCAGAGTLLEQFTGSGALRLVGSGLFCALITLVAIRGMGSAVKVFSWMMPVLLGLSLVVVVSGVTAFGGDGLNFSPAEIPNPLVNHWLLAAVVYVSYNFLSGMGTLTALGTMLRPGKGFIGGVALGGVFLLAVSGGITLAMAAYPDCTGAELPMLALAGALNPALEVIYALVILMGMFGASMSVFVPVSQCACCLWRFGEHPILVTCALSVAAWILGRLEFSTLVGTMYPAFGFIGLLFVLGMVVNTILTFQKKPLGAGGNRDTNQ